MGSVPPIFVQSAEPNLPLRAINYDFS